MSSVPVPGDVLMNGINVRDTCLCTANESEVRGVLALMELKASRMAIRVDATGRRTAGRPGS